MKSLNIVVFVFVVVSFVVSSFMLTRLWTSKAKPKSNVHSPQKTELPSHIRLTENYFPETVVKAHMPGFTVLENVYFKEGQWYIVSDKDIPPVEQMAQATKFNRLTKAEALQTVGN